MVPQRKYSALKFIVGWQYLAFNVHLVAKMEIDPMTPGLPAVLKERM